MSFEGSLVYYIKKRWQVVWTVMVGWCWHRKLSNKKGRDFWFHSCCGPLPVSCSSQPKTNKSPRGLFLRLVKQITLHSATRSQPCLRESWITPNISSNGTDKRKVTWIQPKSHGSHYLYLIKLLCVWTMFRDSRVGEHEMRSFFITTVLAWKCISVLW